MSGKMKLGLQWGIAKKKEFVSYPYWSIIQESSDCFKRKGYGTSRATFSRESWSKMIINFVSYERLLDTTMNRRSDFEKWLNSLISSLTSIKLSNYDEELINKLRISMQQPQVFAQDFELEPFTCIIDDNKIKEVKK